MRKFLKVQTRLQSGKHWEKAALLAKRCVTMRLLHHRQLLQLQDIISPRAEYTVQMADMVKTACLEVTAVILHCFHPCFQAGSDHFGRHAQTR